MAYCRMVTRCQLYRFSTHQNKGKINVEREKPEREKLRFYGSLTRMVACVASAIGARTSPRSRWFPLKVLLAFPFHFCHAESINIIDATGLATQVYKEAAPYFREMGATLRVRIVEKSYYCYTGDPYTLKSQLECMSIFASDRRKTITYFMTPEMNNGWLGGLALFVCSNVAFGTARTEPISSGVPGLQVSGIVLAHEAGHSMCATHQNSKPNLMNADAGIYIKTGKRLPIMRITRQQIKRWYARNRK